MKTPFSLRPVAFLSLFALFAAGTASAQYKVIGADGKVTYTDQPPVESNSKVQTLRLSGAGGEGSEGINAALLPPGLRLPATRYPVTLYTASGCGPCDSGRALLTRRGIPFVEKRAERGEDLQALAKLTGGSRSLPLLVVGTQQVKTLSTAEWQATLDAAGYPQESLLPSNFRPPAPSPIVAPTPPSDAKSARGAVPSQANEPLAPPPPAEAASSRIRF
jgi:glutaredoxin